MAYGDDNDFGWCNIFVKLLLFIINITIWILGMLLLGVGVYVQVETVFDGLGVSDLLTNPAIALIILGILLFIIGFLGCFGALLELYYVLLIYSGLLSIIVLLELGIVIYVYLQRDEAKDQIRDALQLQIEDYFTDANLRDIIDFVQADLLECCGIDEPDNWQANIYFNCSSVAFQRCSVPFSCCQLADGEVVNVQCGYRRLNSSDPTRFYEVNPGAIHERGCLPAAEDFVEANLNLIGGIGIGLLVLELTNILLASGLAIDIRKEKAVSEAYKRRQKAHAQR